MKPVFPRLALLAFCVALALAPFLAPSFAPGARAATQALNGGSGLPLPRFVSLRSDEANLRSGPGTRYPVDWVYTRRDLPVEVIAEFDAWRKIRDWQGTEGWLHETFLSPKRTIVVTGDIAKDGRRRLRADPDEKSPALALLDPNVIAKLTSCPRAIPAYCKVEVQNLQGWLQRSEFWGAYPGEFTD